MSEPAPRSHRITNDFVIKLVGQAGKLGGDILDLGAGNGYFSLLLTNSPEQQNGTGHVEACDIDGKGFSVPGVKLTLCDANRGLPYGDASFDAVIAIEVMEHTRLPYGVLSEINRILKPGGILVFSVPNVGHLISRLSFLVSGHFELYPSPSSASKNAGRICGHVSPLPFQYWHYGLRTSGFSSIDLRSDRTKRGAAFWAAIFWPILKLSTILRLRRLARDPELHDETSTITQSANSWAVLTSRSLVLMAMK